MKKRLVFALIISTLLIACGKNANEKVKDPSDGKVNNRLDSINNDIDIDVSESEPVVESEPSYVVEPQDDSDDQEKAKEAYSKIIDNLRYAYENNLSGEEMANLGIGLESQDSYILADVGYAYFDVNCVGTDELIIGHDDRILQIYTYENDEVILAYDCAYRCEAFIDQFGKIYETFLGPVSGYTVIYTVTPRDGELIVYDGYEIDFDNEQYYKLFDAYGHGAFTAEEADEADIDFELFSEDKAITLDYTAIN